MEIKDIVALAHAGFTAEQIAKMAAVPAAPAQVPAAPAQVPAAQIPAQVPAQIPAQVPAQIPAQIPAQVPAAPAQAPAAPNDPMAQLFAKIDALGTQVQAAALNATQQPPVETVDDILAAIINPPQKNKEGQTNG